MKQGISNLQSGVIEMLLVIGYVQLLLKVYCNNFHIIIKPKLRYLHY